MDMAVFLNQKRANVCEHMTKMASLEFLKGATRGLQEEWIEGNLKENYLRLKYSYFGIFVSTWYISSLLLLFPLFIKILQKILLELKKLYAEKMAR